MAARRRCVILVTSSGTAENSSQQRIALGPLDQVSFSPIHVFRSLHPTGKSLLYNVRDDAVDNLWFQPLDGSAGRQITNFPTEQFTAYISLLTVNRWGCFANIRTPT